MKLFYFPFKVFFVCIYIFEKTFYYSIVSSMNLDEYFQERGHWMRADLVYEKNSKSIVVCYHEGSNEAIAVITINRLYNKNYNEREIDYYTRIDSFSDEIGSMELFNSNKDYEPRCTSDGITYLTQDITIHFENNGQLKQIRIGWCRKYDLTLLEKTQYRRFLVRNGYLQPKTKREEFYMAELKKMGEKNKKLEDELTEMKTAINTLIEKVEALTFAPGGSEYLVAKKDFEGRV